MKKILLTILLLFTVLTACSSPENETALEETRQFEEALETALAATLTSAYVDETALPEETAVPDATDPAPTATLPPLPTPTDAAAPTSAVPTNTPQTPCYRAELIEENIPDGTHFRGGEFFYKTWIIRNTGVCAWTPEFRWVLVEGEDFGVPTEIELARTVLPGEDLVVTLEMKTPALPGNYKGTYEIWTDEGGSVTPLGFWVLVVSDGK